MSAAVSPVCGRAGARLSIFTASTGPSAATGSPVKGEVSAAELAGPGRGGATGLPRPGRTTTSATARPVAAAAPDIPITLFRRRPLIADPPRPLPALAAGG